MRYFIGPDVWAPTVQDIDAAGHKRVESLSEAEVFVNTSSDPAAVPDLPENIQWVQYCFTGVNHLIEAGIIRSDGVPWCNSAGAFAKPVAESALGLLLSQAHHHKAFALAKTWSVAKELDESQAWLYDQQGPRHVVIVGAGGIGRQLIAYLKPFGVHITAVNRSGSEVEGADVTIPIEQVDQVWGEADFVINILPATTATEHFFDAEIFRVMKDSAVFVNVGRGSTVVTDDLVEALREGSIAGAGLEVVDPEPLPEGHPLYDLPNATMTPHMGASFQVAEHHMGAIFNANAAAWERGEPMPTRVDPDAGY
ncbi:D-isomer specific 2-hydroxyacid dehydrogenase family protein [Corynebacterium minutissimum]|uniref:D-isomer specific 2-hydroxyacid dehydrogenase family protein n=1 Tax=Corynebacterium minutissimum TaxID=38301 RepID=UPI001EF280A2|nr:D-isomer specific 2-hydroxyacid dehydrogenase family protein [Corynebacterium minutissimum]MCG7228843.1 D-isomer specific 2-hydroxyacid dehydrogenase family protein [Corynebacterium minutissimum]MCG7237960.1 D-isomer specific 2-hydroxyacid dehydrogenase family protein [Corynebacterium minutissimum]